MLEEKICKTCKTSKPLCNYRVSKQRGKSYYHNECTQCANIKYMKLYYENHELSKEKLKRKARKFYYGISDLDFKLLLESQKNVCAICGTDSPGGRGEWHVDHCHTTGKIRGLLCHHCNTGLGLFRDNIEILQKAIGYLNEHK